MNESSAAKNPAAVPPNASTTCACGAQATEPELMARLDEVLAEYKGRPGALIPVLQIAQGIFGYLPENVLKRIALSLGKSYSEVAGVVGFYSFFSTVPRGRHLVRVCLGTACYVRGGKQVMEACRQELGIEVGGTTADGQFTLEVGRCFGACGLAPTIMIDEDVHQRVKAPRLRELFAAYRADGHGAEAVNAAKAGSGGTSARKAAAKKAASKSTGTRSARTPAPAGSKRRGKAVTK